MAGARRERHIMSVALMGQFYFYYVESCIRFLEPDALLVIVLVFCSLGMVYV